MNSEHQVVFEVLDSMVADAPAPVSFENLADGRVVPERKRPRRTPLVAALAGFVVIIAVIGVIAVAQQSTPNAGPPAGQPDATIFLVPTVIPDDLELSSAEIWSDGNATTQIYQQPGVPSYTEGAPAVTITVSDIVRITEASGGDAVFPTADPSRFFAELKQSAESTYRDVDPDAQLSFDEITVRGNAAIVAEVVTTVDGTVEAQLGVIVLEGNGIVTEVNTQNMAEDVVIAMAEGLQPVTSEAFQAHASATQ